jgi:predicted acetylornithine/succinylornithine family transaminase
MEELGKEMDTTGEIAEVYEKCVVPTYAPGVALVKGKGTKVWDAEGKVYLDFAAGIAVLNLGHCHPMVTEAISRQSAELVHVSNLHYNANQAKLAEKLSSLSGGGKCFFCNSGAEANEAMIKLARAWGREKGKSEVISMRNSFHGRTLGAMAATGQEKIRNGFDPMPAGFHYADFNDLASVAALVNDSTAAILVEAVQGEGGVIPATPEFMQGLRSLCDEKGLLLLCDEVQCGMGRTGKWFGFEHSEVKPDAFSLAKALGNGFPIGAVVAYDSCCDVLQPGAHASTFGGTPLACAAALATISGIEMERLIARVAKTGPMLKEKLEAFVERYEHVQAVRGEGFLLGLVLDAPAKEIVDNMFDIGLITIATAENVIRLVPPLNVDDEDIEEALDILDDALAEWHGVESAEPEAEQAPVAAATE